MKENSIIKKEIEQLIKNNYKKYNVVADNNSAINSVLLTLLKENNTSDMNKAKIFNYITTYLDSSVNFSANYLNIKNNKKISFNTNIINPIRNILFQGTDDKNNKIGDKEMKIISEIFHSCIKVYKDKEIKEFNVDKCDQNIILEEEQEGIYKPFIYDIIHIFNDNYIETRMLNDNKNIRNMLDDGNCGFYAFIDLIKRTNYKTNNNKLQDIVNKIKTVKEIHNKKRNMISYDKDIVFNLRVLLSGLYEDGNIRKGNILKETEWINDNDLELLAKEFDIFIGLFSLENKIYNFNYFGELNKLMIFIIFETNHFKTFIPRKSFFSNSIKDKVILNM